MRCFPLILIALFAVVCGCEHDHIRVTIAPGPDGSFVRTIRLWKTDSDKPGVILAPRNEIVAAARAHYEEEIETKDASVAFRGTFRELPGDIAYGDHRNRGGYDAWSSRMGRLGIYRERRPGPTDYHARFQKLLGAIDLTADLFETVAVQQLDGCEGLDKLVAFLRGPFRTDLKDLTLLLFGSAGRQDVAASDDGDLDERESSAVALAMQLLVERGWFKVRDLPRIGNEVSAEELLQGMIARRMGRPLDDELRRRTAFLFDEVALGAAADKAMAKLGIDDEAAEEAFEPILDAIIDLNFGTDPELEYELVLPAGAETVAASGDVDANGRLRGHARLKDQPVKSIFFATWVVPDRKWQKAHFGKVQLSGEALQGYLMWLHGLPPAQAKAWEAMLERLRPGDAPLDERIDALEMGAVTDETYRAGLEHLGLTVEG